MKVDKRERWAILWRSGKRNKSTHLINVDCDVLLFNTRKEARKFNEENFGYIKGRSDLKGSPHFWKFPSVVRVQVKYRLKEKP